MALEPAASDVIPEPLGHQAWEHWGTARLAHHGGVNLRLVLVTAAIAFGLVGGIFLARVIG